MNRLKSYEKPVMITDELDDGTVVVNFDVTDDYNCTTRTGGYVSTRQDNDDSCYYVTVFNCDGDVLSETKVPFKFINHEDDQGTSS